ncbi:MAG: PQQ-binding-like beta-propeller repeat protein [Candidatus Brocadiia bacterium]
MKRLGLAVLLIVVALALSAPASFGEQGKPKLVPHKKEGAKKDEAKGESQTSLEQRIAANVPKDFPVPLKWPFYAAKLGKAVDIWYAPTATFFIDSSNSAKVEGNIFVQTENNTLCTLSLEGSLKWTAPLTFRLTMAPKVSAFGVYINNLSRIIALDRRNGQIIWLRDYNDLTICTPIHVTPTMLYVGTFNKLVVGINRLSGDIVWTYGLEGDINAATTDAFSPNPADFILAPCFDGNLYAITSAGQELWRFSTYGRLMSTPVVEIVSDSDRYVYFGSQDTNLYCVNATSSQKKWEFRSGSPIEEAPTLCAGNVYVRNTKSEFFCVNKATGILLWKKEGVVGIAGTSIAGDIYLIQGANTLIAVNPATGVERWKAAMPTFVKFLQNTTTPTIYGITKDGLVLAFEEALK